MLDTKYFRSNITEAAEKLAKRGMVLDVLLIKKLEDERKALQIETQRLQNERNVRSKEIGQAKAKAKAKAKGKDKAETKEGEKPADIDINKLTSELGALGDELSQKQKELDEVLLKLEAIYHTTPNLPNETVPKGNSENDNLEIRRVGEVRQFSFTQLDHVALGEKLGLMDFAVAAKISGARFVVLHQDLARMQRALIQFMLDLHTEEHGYKEVYVPYLVNQDSLFGTAQLPKFYDDFFHIKTATEDCQKLALIPTAEVPVTNLMRDTIVAAEQLPLKYVAHTPCFRSEAGSYGKDMRGMIRNHQFEKVELVRFEKPENSYAALEELTNHAEKVLQKLELPYRVIALCGGDLGFASAKTYDIEVWLPGQNKYREISSCSNFEDFQARRMQARWRNPETGKPELVHTLNGSGIAVGRALLAIMENYQDEKGRIHVPWALHEYMGDVRVIE